jgi:hypothetical protein
MANKVFVVDRLLEGSLCRGAIDNLLSALEEGVQALISQ